MNNNNQDNEPSTTEKQWDAARYDSGHSFVWKYGAGVLDLLAPRAGERILDLGCGTAHLSAEIAARGAEVVGIDRSEEMLAQAKELYPGLRFELADATDFHFDEPFDAVFSNAVIHWIRDQNALLACVNRALKPAGRFVAEMGGKGNLRAIKAALHSRIESAGYRVPERSTFRFFASIGEYATLLERHGFTVEQAFYFERPTALEGGEEGLRNWIEVFADNEMSETPVEARLEIIRQAEQELRSELYRDGVWFADYRRLRVAAIKNC